MQSLTKKYTVKMEHTASHIGSGTLDVLGTPALIAYMEETAWGLLKEHLESDDTSVGTAIEMKHLKASAPGSDIIIEAKLTDLNEKTAQFDITATQQDQTIALATHTRAIVSVERFLNSVLK